MARSIPKTEAQLARDEDLLRLRLEIRLVQKVLADELESALHLAHDVGAAADTPYIPRVRVRPADIESVRSFVRALLEPEVEQGMLHA